MWHSDHFGRPCMSLGCSRDFWISRSFSYITSLTITMRGLFSLNWKFFLCKNSTPQFLTGKQLSNSKVHKEYETIFQQLLLWAQMVSNFLAVVVQCSILYYCLGNREGCCLESTLFENDPMSYMTWIFLKNTSTMLFLAISKSPYLRMDLKQCVVLHVHHFTEF